MRVEDIMTKDISSCNASTNAATAAEIMWSKDIGVLPVVEDGGRPVGLVTDRDLFIALGTRNLRADELPLSDVMRRDLALCESTDDVQTALKTMAKQQVHRLPVVDRNGMLAGILSLHELAMRAGSDGLSQEDVARTLKAICENPQPPRSSRSQDGPSRRAVA